MSLFPVAPGATHQRCRSVQSPSSRRRIFDNARVEFANLPPSFDEFTARLDALNYTSSLPKHGSELYLCLACAGGSAAALRSLETRYFQLIGRKLRTMAQGREFAEEVFQCLRMRLFVGTSPKILSYRGDGFLQGWLARTAHRIALDMLRANRRASLGAQRELVERSSIDYQLPCNASYCAQGKRDSALNSLRTAIQTLSPSELELLRRYFIHGEGIDALGAIYCVNRSTAARRIQRVLRRVRLNLQKTSYECEPVLLEEFAGWLSVDSLLAPSICETVFLSTIKSQQPRAVSAFPPMVPISEKCA